MREGSAINLSEKIVLLTWSLFLFLALISIINLLQITYYPVVHRANIESIIHIVLISDQIDSSLVFLFAAFSAFCNYQAFQRLSGNKWLASSSLIVLNLSALLAAVVDFNLALVLVAIGVSGYIMLAAKALKQIICIIEVMFSILCIFEAGSLVHWLLLPFVMPSWIMDLLSRLSAIEAQFFYTPADFTPIAMLIFLFSFPLFTIINRLSKGSVGSQRGDAAPQQLNLNVDGRILLVVAIIMTAIITSYPYLPSINPTGKYVGTDIYYYSQWLGEMEANPSMAINFAIHHISQRPLFLLALYYMKILLQVPTITFLEWIGVPIFCILPISIYCFGLVVKDRNFAGLAAIVSSFSINVVAGIYTAYYSNILALSLQYFALTLLLLAHKRTSYLFISLSSVLSMLTIFIHILTWIFVLVVLILYVGIQVCLGIISHNKIKSIIKVVWPFIILIGVNITIDQLKTFLMIVPSGIGISYDVVSTQIGLNEFLRLGFNLYFTFRFFAGGYFNNLSVIMLSITGIWWLKQQQKGTAKDILVVWLSMVAIPTLFVNFWYNERIFYNLPIQILSTAGLYFTLNTTRKLSKISLFLFILINLNYAFRSVVNLL